MNVQAVMSIVAFAVIFIWIGTEIEDHKFWKRVLEVKKRQPCTGECDNPRCRDVATEKDLYKEALVGLAYDPGWPQDGSERIEAMKQYALETLKAASVTSLEGLGRKR